MRRALLALGLAACAGTASACDNPADGKARATVGAARSAGGATPATAEVLSFGAGASKIEFVGSKVTGKHEGGFRRFEGRVELAPALEDSRLSLTIDMASVYSDSERLTGHLKSADFFDVATYPTATFTTTTIERAGAAGATHTITGNLDLHGVTRSITFPATVRLSPTALEADSEFVLNRKHFEINYPGAADDLIRDEVVIKLTLRVPRPSGT